MPVVDTVEPSPQLRAIVDAIAPGEDYGLSEAERRSVVDAATHYVAGQIAAMSLDLRCKAWAGLTGFRTYALLRRGKPFGALSLDERRRLTDGWSYGSLYLPRQLFRMLRSLTLLAFFEHPLVVRSLAGWSSTGVGAVQRVSLPGRPAH